jgi:hypothetical protein
MTVQTAYAETIDNAYAGMYYGGNPRRVNTKLVETAAIVAGIAVTSGTTLRQAVKGGSGTFLGISVRTLDSEGSTPPTTNAVSYGVGEAIAVMEWGDIYVDLATTGTVGDAIFFTDATGVISAGTASTGETQITGGVLDETIAVAGIARIRIKAGN